jgi:septal ring factor EnvC (AmiA/AmiB activator)
MDARTLSALLVALPLLLAAATPQQLQEAERARAAQLEAARAAGARAAAAAAEERRLGTQRVDAAARLRDLESATEAAAARLEDLVRRRAEAQSRLSARAADLAPLLPVIQRLSLYPAETLLAVPDTPEHTIRGLLVLSAISRQLEAEAASLRAEDAELAAVQTDIDAETARLAATQAAQAQAGAALDRQIAAAAATRRQAEDTAADAQRRAAAEAARADSLRAAIARLEADRQARERQAAAEARANQEAANRVPIPAVPEPRGALTLTAPVAGTILRGFGEAGEAGPTTGISYRAAPAARVVAPCGGRVVFAGPFRSFGLLMIVDCGASWHAVMAGFDRLDAAVGQTVQQGEPIGQMPGWDPTGASPRPSLYVELRHDGAPVNPAPFLRAKL